MARYIIKLNNEPQIETKTITHAIEYIIACSGEKHWRPFFYSKQYFIYDSKLEKIIWSSKVNFQIDEILEFNMFGVKITGKYVHHNIRNILIDVNGKLKLIHSHFLCK